MAAVWSASIALVSDTNNGVERITVVSITTPLAVDCHTCIPAGLCTIEIKESEHMLVLSNYCTVVALQVLNKRLYK